MSDVPERIDKFLVRGSQKVECAYDCVYDPANNDWLFSTDYEAKPKKYGSGFIRGHFLIQVSPSSIAGCRACGLKIPRAQIRLGYPLKDCRGTYGVITAYTHFSCSHDVVAQIATQHLDDTLKDLYAECMQDLDSTIQLNFNAQRPSPTKATDKPKRKAKIEFTDADAAKAQDATVKDNQDESKVSKPKKPSARKKKTAESVKADDVEVPAVKAEGSSSPSHAESSNLETMPKAESSHVEHKARTDEDLPSVLNTEHLVTCVRYEKIPPACLEPIQAGCINWDLLTVAEKAQLVYYAYHKKDENQEDTQDADQYLDDLVKRRNMVSQEPPPELLAPLLPFQKEGLAWMCAQENSTLRGGILADEMGMGKTIQMIALLLARRQGSITSMQSTVETSPNELPEPVTSGVGATLVVAPIAAVMQWKNEIQKFSKPDTLKVMIYHGAYREALLKEIQTYDVVITTYATVESDYRRVSNAYKVTCQYCGRMFLIDKLRFHQQYFCGPEAIQTARQAKREKKRKTTIKKAMSTLDIGKGDADLEPDDDYVVPSVGNVYRSILKEADKELAERFNNRASWIFPNQNSKKSKGSQAQSLPQETISGPSEAKDVEAEKNSHLQNSETYEGLIEMGFDPDRVRELMAQMKGDFHATLEALLAEKNASGSTKDTEVVAEDLEQQLARDRNEKLRIAKDLRSIVTMSISGIKKQSTSELRRLLRLIDKPTYGTKLELINRLLLLLYPEEWTPAIAKQQSEDEAEKSDSASSTVSRQDSSTAVPPSATIDTRTNRFAGRIKGKSKQTSTDALHPAKKLKKIESPNAHSSIKAEKDSLPSSSVALPQLSQPGVPSSSSAVSQHADDAFDTLQDSVKSETIVDKVKSPGSLKSTKKPQRKSLKVESDRSYGSKSDTPRKDKPPAGSKTSDLSQSSSSTKPAMKRNNRPTKLANAKKVEPQGLLQPKSSHKLPVRACRLKKNKLKSMLDVLQSSSDVDLSEDSVNDETVDFKELMGNGGSDDDDSFSSYVETNSQESDYSQEDVESDLSGDYALSSYNPPPPTKYRGSSSRRPRVSSSLSLGTELSTESGVTSSFAEEEDDDDSDIGASDIEEGHGESISLKLSPLHAVKWYRIVLDEAHRIKSRVTSTAKAVNALSSRYARWCLTGTPLQNRISELYSLIRFLRMEPYGYYYCAHRGCECKSLHFRFHNNRFCVKCAHARTKHFSYFNRSIVNPIKKFGYRQQGQDALQELKSKVLNKVLLRRTKQERAEDMNLPSLTILIRRDSMEPAERDFYESLYKQTCIQFDTYVNAGTLLHNYAHIFDLLSRLRQAVDHPYLVVYGSLAASSGLDIPAPGRGDSDVCGLCQDDIQPIDLVISACKHSFHLECIREYVSTVPVDTLARSAPGPGTMEELNEINAPEHAGETESATLVLNAALRGSGINCPVCFSSLTVDLGLSSRPQASIPSTSTKRQRGILSRINTAVFQSSSKIEALVQELESVGEQDPQAKSIVFSQFTSMLDLIEWRLKKGGIQCVKFTGALSMEARSNILYVFNTDPNMKVILISLKAGGEGLNLQVANNIFLMDPWWNPAAELQAIQRAHRIGQKKPVRAVRFICENTIEEKMLQLQEKKHLVFEGTIDGNAASMAKLTQQDLRFLFGG